MSRPSNNANARPQEGEMATEWTTIDKTGWERGPWDEEPDKVQWVDEETGLDCLMVRRTSLGHLCGYVGVPASHPWHGLGYSDCVQGCGEEWCDHRPESLVDVHGGLTFASGCSEPTEEQWASIEEQLADPKLLAEAEAYPNAHAARRLAYLREQRGLTFDEWREYQMARRICHVPLPGRPDDVWWFGFDCAHSGDFSPGRTSEYYRRLFAGIGRTHFDVYRSRRFVEQEVASLAAQLQAVVR